ncbi:integrating conjugative element protein, partial [Pseudomonas aeruginosa]|nr:integrating conjugative element protein [Pseudomonas aeruginosa]MBG4241653.1 integrating conjugative element protein [Pseudomonas aeruginosa]
QSLQELLSKSKPLTAENLAAAGTDALPITRGVIEALRDERDQDVLARRLASDVSLMDVLSKALLLQRLMFAGAKEPNVAANGLATQAVDQQTSLLQQEISNLKTELELRRELASNSPMRVIERGQQRASGSSGVFESAPDADRLDRLQAPSAAGGKSGGRP